MLTETKPPRRLHAVVWPRNEDVRAIVRLLEEHDTPGVAGSKLMGRNVHVAIRES